MLDALSFRCCLSDGSTWHFSPFAKVPRTKFCTKDMGVLSSSQKISLIQPSVALTPLVNHNPQATVLLVWYANMLLYQSKTREKLLIILCAYELAGHPNAHSSYDKRSSLAYSLYLVLYHFIPFTLTININQNVFIFQKSWLQSARSMHPSPVYWETATL